MAFYHVAQVIWCTKYTYHYFVGSPLKVVLMSPMCSQMGFYRHGKKVVSCCKNVPKKFSSIKGLMAVTC